MSIYKTRLSEFRQVFKKLQLDAFIIPQGDRWQSEHPDPSDLRLNYLTGLDSSAGYSVVTQEKACVLIDARYTISAKQQVDTSLFNIEYYTDILPENWAIRELPAGSVIGYDPWLHTHSEAKRMKASCDEKGYILKPVLDNPVDKIWYDKKPSIQYTTVNHDLKYSGQSAENKCKDVAKIIDENGVDVVIINSPDSIAWLLNIRSLNNPQSPGLRGFAFFNKSKKNIKIYTDTLCDGFESSEISSYSVEFFPLDKLLVALNDIQKMGVVLQISEAAPDYFFQHFNQEFCKIITKPDPCEMLKACKNSVEQQGVRDAHSRDAIAIKNVIYWIKESKQLTENNVKDRLFLERSKSNLFHGVSFDSIVGWNANGAKIHGTPTEQIIEGDGLLLIDSGGQYDDGTTDITRTIAFGNPSKDMMEKYTLVLRAHIALANAIFPEGTTGIQLDAITRAPLWQAGIDFAHGTGHGVGFFLNVHEGPCGISPRANCVLREGMLLSNEPGFYKEGAYGIRLENLMLVQKYKDIGQEGNETGKKLLCFETVTKVPFDEDCILRDMMLPHEILWLDKYQKETV